MKHTINALSNFKIHTKRKNLIYSPSYIFVKNNDLFRKNTLLEGYIKSTTKQLFNLSHSLKIYNEFNFTSLCDLEPKKYLNSKQFEYYNKCMKYVPSQFSYFLIDYISSTNSKTLDLEPQKFLLKLGFKFLVNVKSSLENHSDPKCNSSIYNTIPRPFSPLFFLELQFADFVLKDKLIRNDFKKCLEHLVEKQYQKSIHNILNANSREELNHLINSTISNFHDNWRIPDGIKSKVKQVNLYTNNLFTINPLFQLIIIDYMYSYNQNIMNCSPKEIYNVVKNKLKNYLYKNCNDLFHNFDLKHNSYLFNEARKVYTQISSLLRPSSKYCVNKYKLVSNYTKTYNIA